MLISIGAGALGWAKLHLFLKSREVREKYIKLTTTIVIKVLTEIAK